MGLSCPSSEEFLDDTHTKCVRKTIIICLNSNFGIYDYIVCSKTPYEGLAPINEVKDVLIRIRYIMSIITKNMLNMRNSTNPYESK